MTAAQENIVINSIDNKDIVLRLPCGGGKTVVNLQIAAAHTRGFTVFIVPTKALQESVAIECKTQNIQCELYHAASQEFTLAKNWNPLSQTRVVVAVFDSSVGGFLVNFMRETSRKQLVNRIVIDEIHIYYESANFRPAVSMHMLEELTTDNDARFLH